MITAVPDAGVADLLRWVIRRRARFAVVGPSMEPTLVAGDMVLVDSSAPPTENDIVCAIHPKEPSIRIVKRIAFIDENGSLFLSSDNTAAVDAAASNTFGMVQPDAILGIVTAKIRRKN